MRRVSRCLLGLAAVLLVSPPARGAGPADLEARLRSALAAEEASVTTSGADLPAPTREERLRDLLADEPDYAPARAELGEIEVEGQWEPVQESQRLAEEDPRLDAYRELLATASNDVPDQLRLARWCDKQGLDHHARRHWLAVLTQKPDHPDALEGLNLTRRDGALWDAEVAAEAQDRAVATQRSAKAWEKRFRRYENRRRARPEELNELREELDAGATGPIERRVAALVGGAESRAAERADELVRAWIAASSHLDELEVTATLCRIATFAAPEHRRRAIDALHQRPQLDSMPLLLSALVAPIESEHRIDRDRQGNVAYQHLLRRNQAENRLVHERRRTADVRVSTTSPSGPRFRSFTTRASIYEAYLAARFDGLKNELAYQREAEATDRWVEQHNRLAGEVNSRVIGVLAELSGGDLGDEPHTWWDHWRELTGYEVYDRPVQRTYDVTHKVEQVVATPTLYEIPPPPPPPRCECFVAGTPVWTRTGQQPIEAVREGDLVLARDPHRGGLTYRVVLGKTLREPSPMVELTAAGETIQATEGHPFWVVNQGWRMAKHLREGDVLSTLDGPTPLESIGPATPQPAHNLIIESAANYYVGERGVLVHDNTPRRPAVGLVAGR